MITCVVCALALGQLGSFRPLWQIGTFDHTGAEFALAPAGYRLYRNDPTYVILASKPNTWPYVLPGPDDGWAGGRPHRASVYFGLSGVNPPAASWRFVCDLVETHNSVPPHLTLWINGNQVTSWQAPVGNGDEAINGHPETGRHTTWATNIPGGNLRAGVNVLEIRSERGSWVLFDALRLDGPRSLSIVPVPPDIRVKPLAQEQAVLRTTGGPRQQVGLEITNLGKPGRMELSIAGIGKWSKDVTAGTQTVQISIPAVKVKRHLPVRLRIGEFDATKMVEVQPVRPWTVYLLPHSHVDIGYTDYQPVVEKMHRRNLFDAMAVAKESAGFPKDSRYRLNLEATWILDGLLRDGTSDEVQRVRNGFKNGLFDCSAGYCNTLTALMRPEELMRSYGYADSLRKSLGLDLQTATQTDAPGVTWGAVAAMSQAGVRNLVLMPNPSDRVGGVLTAWQDKPFFWVSPSGKERVLVWETASYGVGHGLRHFNGDRTKIFRTANPTKGFIDAYIFNRLSELAEAKYPYDVLALPWSGTDNFPVDADVPYAVRHWNETYVVPRVVTSTVTEACNVLKSRFASKIPVVRGDFTPYWEDGAGSSASETATNRATADRLVQAETLSAVRNPAAYDAMRFWRAWSNVILYSEHTWGAYNSISEPDAESVKQQWAYKRNFAVQGSKASYELLAKGLGSTVGGSFSVANTTSWPRTDLVILTRDQSRAGDRVVDAKGRPVASQRLRTGELAILAKDVPPFGGSQFRIVPGRAFSDQEVSATGWQLRSADWTVTLDPNTGAVSKLWNTRLGRDLADHRSGRGLNEYLYLPGTDLKNLKAPTDVHAEIIEPGPLVARIRVTSSAAGARRLMQDVQLVAGLDRVDLDNEIDKTAVRSKEGVHFAFPFAVPNGQVRIHGPWAVIRPDFDQIAGSNKNWFNTQYFADVSNSKFGVTWSSLDAPLMEVGGITANLLGGVYDPKDWLHHVGPTQTIYSWALNNHWHTNYRAEQEGLLTFRYSIRAHDRYAADQAYRFGADRAQPLLVTGLVNPSPLLQISDPRVVATSLRPSSDGKAVIVRLWCVGDKPTKARLSWQRGLIGHVSLSDSSERAVRRCNAEIPIAGWQALTLRAERK